MLHSQDDAECLELSTTIRVVLGGLIEKFAALKKDDTDLKKAIGTLTKGKLEAKTAT